VEDDLNPLGQALGQAAGQTLAPDFGSVPGPGGMTLAYANDSGGGGGGGAGGA
jgi:hypothetical protein